MILCLQKVFKKQQSRTLTYHFGSCTFNIRQLFQKYLISCLNLIRIGNNQFLSFFYLFSYPPTNISCQTVIYIFKICRLVRISKNSGLSLFFVILVFIHSCQILSFLFTVALQNIFHASFEYTQIVT